MITRKAASFTSNISQRGAPKMEHLEQPLGRQPSWDDIRLFLECASRSSFRRAAHDLRLSSSTVTRRMERLETALGSRLFDRIPDGVTLTEAGQTLLGRARTMERAAFDVMRTAADAEAERSSVTVSITEGLGSYWMMRHLVRFQRQHPSMQVNMRCAMESADVLRLEADMAIQFQRPTNPDLMFVRLGKLHVYPFASQDYLDTYGVPRDAEDMVNHRLVNQVAPQLDQEAWARYLGLESIDQLVGIATNASTGILYAVENGAGIGALPTYVGVINRDIVPVDIGIRHQLDTWLTYHPDIKLNRRKAYMIEWIRRIFDPQTHPWFRDEFIHPTELRKVTVADQL